MVSIENICKRDIEFKDNCIFDANTRICVTGRNGRGKTTLLRIIGGMLLPDSGIITVNTDRYAFPLHFGESNRYLSEIRHEVFYLENTDFLYPYFSVNDCLSYYCSASTINLSKVKEYLEALHFGELFSKRICDLSLGTKQKIVDSLCLASNKSLIVCDEPTIGLDTQSKETFYDLATHLNCGIVFSTNDEWLSEKFDTRIVCSDNREVFLEK